MDSSSKSSKMLKRVWRFGYTSTIDRIRLNAPEPILELKSKLIEWRERKIILQDQQILRELIAEKKAGKDYHTIIIFPPGLDWNVQLFQRPQQLASALAKQGALVFYIEPKPDHRQPPFKLFQDRLYLCPVHSNTFKILTEPLIYLLTWNCRSRSHFLHPKIIYDYLDDIQAFHGNPKKLARDHQYLLRNAHYVLASARKLLDEVHTIRKDVLFSPNGVEYELFARAARRQFPVVPQDLLPIVSQSQPIIGYYGALARWFDYELLSEVADVRPGYQFVLIGPNYDGTMEMSDILRKKNIHWLGVKPYQELPNYLQYFDAAIIPFILNNVTHATSPLKLFEYMAAEKPIVITPMQESMYYPGVLVGKAAPEFADQIDKALEKRSDQNYLSLLRQTALDNTWIKRAEDILSAIEQQSQHTDWSGSRSH